MAGMSTGDVADMLNATSRSTILPDDTFIIVTTRSGLGFKVPLIAGTYTQLSDLLAMMSDAWTATHYTETTGLKLLLQTS